MRGPESFDVGEGVEGKRREDALLITCVLSRSAFARLRKGSCYSLDGSIMRVVRHAFTFGTLLTTTIAILVRCM